MCLSKDLDFYQHAIVLFMFDILKWEVIVRFVDIGGSFCHYYFSFLFINTSYFINSKKMGGNEIKRIHSNLGFAFCFKK